MIRISKLRIPIFSLFCLGAFIIIEPSIYLLFMLGSAFFHECGHLVMMKLWGSEIHSVTLLPLGIDIKTVPSFISYPVQIAVSSAGAGVNLLLFLIFFKIGGNFTFFAYFNLLYAVFNLIPVKGLDGAEILESISNCFFEQRTTEKIIKITSFVFCTILWVFGIYMLLILNGNISIFALSLFLFASVFIKKNKG